MWKRSYLLLFVFGLLLCCCGASLQWNASIPDETHGAATGYRIHRGTAPGVYDWQTDAGNVLQWPIPDDLYGSYYWTTSAYNDAGSSGYSNEVFWQRAPPTYAGATNLKASRYQVGSQTMAFPTTGVLDNFTGAGPTTPPSASWTNIVGSVYLYTNVCVGSTALDIALRNTTTYGPDSEVYAKIDTKTDANKLWLFARMTTLVSSTMDGYAVLLTFVAGASNDTVQIYRIDNGAGTQLGSTITQEFSAGDKIGLEVVGSSVKAYRCPSGGSWAQIGSTQTDTTYSSAGYIGLGFEGTSSAFDDFGGGTVVAASAVPANRGNVGMMLGMSNAMWLDSDFLNPTGGN